MQYPETSSWEDYNLVDTLDYTLQECEDGECSCVITIDGGWYELDDDEIDRFINFALAISQHREALRLMQDVKARNDQ